jgi:hypothetical protein
MTTFTQEDLDNALAEGFVAGALATREAERDRIYEEITKLDIVAITVADLFALIYR